jgi:hypothetical protein
LEIITWSPLLQWWNFWFWIRIWLLCKDVTIYLTKRFSDLCSSFRLNQILQIVIVPGSYAKLINKNDYGNVMSILKLKYWYQNNYSLKYNL